VSGQEVLLTAVALLAVASAMLAVTSLRVVHCALWLVVCLGSLAGVYLLLGAEVVALVQLLVYVGAVVVLVLFALMVTRTPTAPTRDLDAPPGRRLAGLAAGLGLAGLVGGTLMTAVGDARIDVEAGRGSARAVGTAIFGGWVLPFELLSVLLLAALVGALALSRESVSPERVSPERVSPERVSPVPAPDRGDAP
jgi:NADH-quinone oxidoreductase subunit J